MVRHIIFFKFKDDAETQVEAAVKALQGLKTEIPWMRSFSIGKSNSRGPRAPRYNWAMVMDFDTFEDLDRYNKSEAHDRVVKESLVPVVEHITGVDYDLETYAI